MLRPLLDNGFFPSIEELRISAFDSFPERTGQWEHLKRLDIVELTDKKIDSMLGCINASVQMDDLPSLQTVCVLTDRKLGAIFSIDDDTFPRLKQEGVAICIVKPYLEKIMVNACLA